ncbi:sensor histidine kinase [[Clostridium] fimetarium]|uniref:GHKL domain-containing protein n=1 Tax=[Clostridium] fimetarium TaxID=99656 RepID=A0A1I0RPI0_9FIRM|nr:GHKL domain-containing protein [[Clostridium] fimetarium]SEW43171.1 GHKL domain-containing protein [[Clostridium] fimetarium]
MKNMIIFAIISTILEFIKYLIAYAVIFDFKIRKTKKLFIIPLSVVCIIQVIVVYKIDSTWVSTLLLIMGLYIPIICIEGIWWEKILAYIIIVPGVSIVDMLGFSGIIAIVGSEMDKAIGDNIMKLIGNSLSLIVLIILIFIKKLDTNKRREVLKLTFQQYIVIICGIIGCLLILAGAQWILIGGEISENGKNIWFIAIAFASCCFMILSIWQIVTLSKAENYKDKNLHYEEYIRLQENYIKAIIDNDKMIRNFKHDINAHLTVINEYCLDIKDERLINYLNAIKENSGLNSIKKYTGNIVIDAVLGEIIKSAEDDKISIEWRGKIPNEIGVEAYDLCTVISNIIRNAVEASEKLDNDSDKVIKAESYVYQNKIYFKVENNLFGQIAINDGNRIKTTKEDKKNHGFGNDNVRRVVDKYNGSIKYSCKENVFKTGVLI